MSRKRYTPEQIIGKLREAEVLLSQGQRTGEVCRRLGISEQAPRRVPEPRNLLLTQGGPNRDRAMTATLQHATTAFRTGL